MKCWINSISILLSFVRRIIPNTENKDKKGRRWCEVWVSRKKWELLNKKVADLEGQCRGQQEVMQQHLKQHKSENESYQKALKEISSNFSSCIYEVKAEILKEITQELNHQGRF